MKLLLSSLLLGNAVAQITPMRLRSHTRVLKKDRPSKRESNDIEVVVDDSDSSENSGEFGLFEDVELLSKDDSLSMSMIPTQLPTADTSDDITESMSMSVSMSMSDSPTPAATFVTDEPTLSVTLEPTFVATTKTDFPTSYSMSMSMSMSMTETSVPTPEPSFLPTPYTPEPSTTTDAPVVSTSPPTLSKSGKESTNELIAYSWDLPSEYTGYFEMYLGKSKGKETTDDLELIDVVELGTGTSGADSAFLRREEYTIVAVNVNRTVGYCCEGSSPGWLHFTYGGIEYHEFNMEYKEKKDKDKFIAEFHKNPKKVNIGEDGAYYVFSIKL